MAIPSQNLNKKKETNDLSQASLATIKEAEIDPGIPKSDIDHPIWLSVSECARIGGVTTKTIRRAIQSKKLKYKIVMNRYLIELTSLITYLNTTVKLKNKLLNNGIGQYVEKWKK